MSRLFFCDTCGPVGQRFADATCACECTDADKVPTLDETTQAPMAAPGQVRARGTGT